MANPQQNEVQNGTEQFKKDINLLQDKIKKFKKMKKGESQKWKTDQTKPQKGIKYIGKGR